MAIGDNSYGSVAEVAALTGRYTASGSYSGSTRPTTTQVEQFIDRVSAIVNALLAEAGFDIPVDDADPKLILDEFVVNQAAQLAHAANGAGIYSPSNEQLRKAGKTPFSIIYEEAEGFISDHAQGLELLGAGRSRGMTYGLASRTTDDSGDTIHPMFSRKQMQHQVLDWDVAE